MSRGRSDPSHPIVFVSLVAVKDIQDPMCTVMAVNRGSLSHTVKPVFLPIALFYDERYFY